MNDVGNSGLFTSRATGAGTSAFAGREPGPSGLSGRRLIEAKGDPHEAQETKKTALLEGPSRHPLRRD